MTRSAMAARIRTLRAELDALSAALRSEDTEEEPLLFGNLCGVFKGQAHVTDEDLEEAKYSFEWEGETMGKAT